MTSLAQFYPAERAPCPLRDGFLRWQCRTRQIAMREQGGRPDAAMMPLVLLTGREEPLGHIISVLSKLPAYSRLPEMKQIYRATHDRAERRKRALELFSETYYQRAHEFCDRLTATFAPGSEGAGQICAAGTCTLRFEAYSQRFDLDCSVTQAAPGDALAGATLWHNRLFDPNIHPETVVLVFTPNWNHSTATPTVGEP